MQIIGRGGRIRTSGFLVPIRKKANGYLEEGFLPWWNQHLVIAPANATDAHRSLGAEHNLAASLSEVETRQVDNDYTLQVDGKFLRIERSSICAGLRGATVRIERRPEGSVAVRFRERYLEHTPCQVRAKRETAAKPVGSRTSKPRKPSVAMRDSMDRLFHKPGPPVWKAGKIDRTRTADKLEE